MKSSFISSILTGADGTLSSKRTVFLLLVFLFAAVVVVSLIWKEKLLDQNLQSHLVNLIYVNGGLVAVEKPMSNLGQLVTMTKPQASQAVA